MNYLSSALIMTFGLAISHQQTLLAADPSAVDILKDADRARGSAAVEEGITWSVKVDTSGEDGSNSVSYLLKVKGSDALAEAVAPARNKGEMMLFNDRNIWFFKPGLKKPVAISPRQKLMGQAANGDIASTNYAKDYEGTIMATETVNGEACWKLDLKAKAKNVTYDKIRYWISKKDRLGVKAEFLTVSGDVFKLAAFEYKNKLNSGTKDYAFVSKMTITDALNPKNITTLNYESPKPSKLSDSLFNVNNLVR
ncbi:MAG: outer membrane lipoprotein-sorting protein [Proteobacteria bacterium]|nr:outer membrane lipoprotein-sorting protein [Pseudomonadota bacterium]